MDKDYLIQLTKNLYSLTILFPKKEPLRYKMREVGDDVLIFFYQDKIKEFKNSLEALDGLFEIAKDQKWVELFQVANLQKNYNELVELLDISDVNILEDPKDQKQEIVQKAVELEEIKETIKEEDIVIKDIEIDKAQENKSNNYQNIESDSTKDVSSSKAEGDRSKSTVYIEKLEEIQPQKEFSNNVFGGQNDEQIKVINEDQEIKEDVINPINESLSEKVVIDQEENKSLSNVDSNLFKDQEEEELESLNESESLSSNAGEIPDRQKKILEALKEMKRCQVWQIQKLFPDVSRRTLRRDFESMLRNGLVKRIGEKNDTYYELN